MLHVEEFSPSVYPELAVRSFSGLTIFWNQGEEAMLRIDHVEKRLKFNELVFLTEFHRVQAVEAECLRVIRFNRAFFCIVDHDSEVGCKGLLFFGGASQVPIISLPAEEEEKFSLLWRLLGIEMQTRDSLQFEMLQMMLKRLLILCTRLYKQQRADGASPADLELVRAFNFLVETHFRTRHDVAAYADLLHKSPKTLANVFLEHHTRTPLQAIHDRILLEARRLLTYTDKPVKEIAGELGFADLQAFSRFFRGKEGVAPTVYRESPTSGKMAHLPGKIG